IDHHMASWGAARPSWVRAILPTHDEPTTTMRLLVQAELVRLPHANEFIAGLCRRAPPFDWGLVFDALHDGKPPRIAGFDELLTLGPHGGPVPDPLRQLAQQSERVLEAVRSTLDAAPSVITDHLAVVHLASAASIPLRHYSLEIARRYPRHVSALVHRRKTLYTARNGHAGHLDLMTHFQQRGFDPKGHPHVFFIHLKPEQVEAELAALADATRTP
ncbi:MAG: hypothetical protein ABW321_27800, partial [Polyangiales bacterium]